MISFDDELNGIPSVAASALNSHRAAREERKMYTLATIPRWTPGFQKNGRRSKKNGTRLLWNEAGFRFVLAPEDVRFSTCVGGRSGYLRKGAFARRAVTGAWDQRWTPAFTAE